MSDTFNPGDGWVRYDKLGKVPEEHIAHYDGSTLRGLWVRVPPLPPLPTEPYTVVSVTWARGARAGAEDVLTRLHAGWYDTEGTIYAHNIGDGDITSWEPLAEPRAVTANRIADWFEREGFGYTDEHWRNRAARTIRREFGVES